MTIKQQGGIFGRNPTFNDLTAGSGSSIEGSGSNVSFRVDRTDASTDGALVLYAKGGTVGIDSDGADKDLTFSTAGQTERARFFGDKGGFWLRSGSLVVDSGQGIDFSATSGTGTSELFDDYEEGTFTPTVTSSSGTFTTVSASGAYTLIGRKVFLHGRITITDAGTASGTLNITLPFANIVYDAAGSAYEYAAVGFSAAIRVSALASTANLIKYDGTTAIGTGNRLSYAIAYNI